MSTTIAVAMVFCQVLVIVLAGDPGCNNYQQSSYSYSYRTLASTLSNKTFRRHVKLVKKTIAQSDVNTLAAQTAAVVTDVSQLPSTWIDYPGLGPSNTNNGSPTFYTSQGQSALTCQIDCLSMINGRKVFASCGYRFYKYGSLTATQGCYENDNLSQAQATLVQQICQQKNSCQRAAIAFTPANLARVVGRNTYISPVYSRYGMRVQIP